MHVLATGLKIAGLTCASRAMAQEGGAPCGTWSDQSPRGPKKAEEVPL